MVVPALLGRIEDTSRRRPDDYDAVETPRHPVDWIVTAGRIRSLPNRHGRCGTWGRMPDWCIHARLVVMERPGQYRDLAPTSAGSGGGSPPANQTRTTRLVHEGSPE